MNPADLPLAEAAAQLRARQLRARDLVEAHLERIAARDGRIGAFVALDAEGARRAADLADTALDAGEEGGPLLGIPVAIKDLVEVEGQPLTCGSRIFADRVATKDAAVISALRRAGAIPLGMVATYEFALTGPTFDSAYPPARNPWNVEHITGGSSSGSAAAVAGGLVRIALGTDTGGSVRSPAAYCGVVGLKPTYGLVPMEGVFPLSPGLDHLGPLAASVSDAALMLEAMAPGSSGLDGLGLGVRGLRIGYARDWFADDPAATPALVAAMDEAVSVLSMLGAKIRLIALPDYALAEAAGAVILHAEALHLHRKMLADQLDGYGRQARQSLAAGAGLSKADMARARKAGVSIRAAIDSVMSDCDVIVTPTTLAAAPPVAAFQREETVWTAMRTLPFNLTGHPALSLPIGFEGGLPLGMQIIGKHRAEAMICRVGAAFEAATDHSAQRPYFA
ncbi:amidase [Paracoccus zhejiangensis]|uniref:Amidase n=1 Tax=Paracoccus zhejiangensis TaxID=1077935 RepID=A0A2H5F0E0_9RHOB|nr:amidase [Paracoccus zhejiangensis]AUH65000.1 amidase [Paracoccus zhejiangensis]